MKYAFTPKSSNIMAIKAIVINKVIFVLPFCCNKILKNTMILGGLKILLVLPVPVLLSLMLNEVKKQKLKKGIQTIICIPYFCPG